MIAMSQPTRETQENAAEAAEAAEPRAEASPAKAGAAFQLKVHAPVKIDDTVISYISDANEADVVVQCAVTCSEAHQVEMGEDGLFYLSLSECDASVLQSINAQVESLVFDKHHTRDWFNRQLTRDQIRGLHKELSPEAVHVRVETRDGRPSIILMCKSEKAAEDDHAYDDDDIGILDETIVEDLDSLRGHPICFNLHVNSIVFQRDSFQCELLLHSVTAFVADERESMKLIAQASGIYSDSEEDFLDGDEEHDGAVGEEDALAALDLHSLITTNATHGGGSGAAATGDADDAATDATAGAADATTGAADATTAGADDASSSEAASAAHLDDKLQTVRQRLQTADDAMRDSIRRRQAIELEYQRLVEASTASMTSTSDQPGAAAARKAAAGASTVAC